MYPSARSGCTCRTTSSRLVLRQAQDERGANSSAHRDQGGRTADGGQRSGRPELAGDVFERGDHFFASRRIAPLVRAATPPVVLETHQISEQLLPPANQPLA